MQPVFQKRPLTPKESQLLMKLSAKKAGGPVNHIKYYHFLMAAVLGIGFTWLAMLTEDSFWAFPFGTLAVFSFGFIRLVATGYCLRDAAKFSFILRSNFRRIARMRLQISPCLK